MPLFAGVPSQLVSGVANIWIILYAFVLTGLDSGQTKAHVQPAVDQIEHGSVKDCQASQVVVNSMPHREVLTCLGLSL